MNKKLLFTIFIFCFSYVFSVDPRVLPTEVRLRRRTVPLRTIPLGPHEAHSLNLNAKTKSYDPKINYQWIVSLKGPITQKLKDDLKSAIHPYEIENYVPHNSFLIYCPRHVVEKALLVSGVIGFNEMMPEDKISSSLFSKDSLKSLQSSSDHVDISVVTFPSTENHFDGIARKVNDELYIMRVKSDTLIDAIAELSSRPYVKFVEDVKPYKLNNRYAHSLIQSNDPNPESEHATPIWEHGILGEGEIVASGDTGVDYDHCMFGDPDYDLPIYPSKNYAHRKIVQYIFAVTEPSGVGDLEGGHGTHTAGTIAGHAQKYGNITDDEVEETTPFNGQAPLAKLAIYDLSDTAESSILRLPADLEEQYYGIALRLGAYLHSNSWGAAVMSEYTHSEMLSDRYVYRHREFLPIFSNGNEGEDPNYNYGYMSVGSPAGAKNVLGIGASRTTHANFASSGQGFGLYIDAPSSLKGPHLMVVAGDGMGLDWSTIPTNTSFGVFSDAYANIAVANPLDACTPLANSGLLAGKLVLFKRGSCTFVEKLTKVTDAGAIAGLLVNNAYGFVYMGDDGTGNCDGFCVPSACVEQEIGDNLIAQVGQLNLHLPITGAYDEKTFNYDRMAEFSSRGPMYDGRIKPDISAVGAFVVSARSDGLTDSNNCGYDDTLIMEGTSMACPAAAGSIALIREYYREGWYPTGSKVPQNGFIPAASLLKASIINSGVAQNGSVHYHDKSFSLSDTPPDFFQGYGRMVLENVLTFSTPPNRGHQLFVVNEEHPLNTGDTKAYCFQINSLNFPFKVTLVWTDYWAEVVSEAQLINDLDLSVYYTGGTYYYGNNKRDVSGNQLWDTVNNVEQIWIAQTGSVSGIPGHTGYHLVEVHGANVPMNAQNYSLVVTGDITEVSLNSCYQTSIPCDSCDPEGSSSCVNGRCVCNIGFYGTSCQIEAETILFRDALNGDYFPTTIEPLTWHYYKFFISDNDIPAWQTVEYMRFKYWRLVKWGDPDAYIQYEKLPTLTDYLAADKDMEFYDMNINMPRYAHSLNVSTQLLQEGNYYIGFYGFPPFNTTFGKNFLPDKDPTEIEPDGFPGYGIALIVVGVVVLGVVFFIFVRRMNKRIALTQLETSAGATLKHEPEKKSKLLSVCDSTGVPRSFIIKVDNSASSSQFMDLVELVKRQGVLLKVIRVEYGTLKMDDVQRASVISVEDEQTGRPLRKGVPIILYKLPEPENDVLNRARSLNIPIHQFNDMEAMFNVLLDPRATIEKQVLTVPLAEGKEGH